MLYRALLNNIELVKGCKELNVASLPALCQRGGGLTIEHSVSGELILYIPEAFMALQAQAISGSVLPKISQEQKPISQLC